MLTINYLDSGYLRILSVNLLHITTPRFLQFLQLHCPFMCKFFKISSSTISPSQSKPIYSFSGAINKHALTCNFAPFILNLLGILQTKL